MRWHSVISKNFKKYHNETTVLFSWQFMSNYLQLIWRQDGFRRSEFATVHKKSAYSVRNTVRGFGVKGVLVTLNI